MGARAMRKGTKGSGSGEPAYLVEFDHDTTDGGEEGLLRVYEFLLGLPGLSEIDSSEGEMT